jgi:hypothetical protein
MGRLRERLSRTTGDTLQIVWRISLQASWHGCRSATQRPIGRRKAHRRQSVAGRTVNRPPRTRRPSCCRPRADARPSARGTRQIARKVLRQIFAK